MFLYAFSFFSVFFPLFIYHMTSLNIGTFNINGCRGTAKRAALFDYLILKKADIVLLQETHTDVQSQTHWARDWKGNASLSHGTNLSAGVAILFSSRIVNQPVNGAGMVSKCLEFTLGMIIMKRRIGRG